MRTYGTQIGESFDPTRTNKTIDVNSLADELSTPLLEDFPDLAEIDYAEYPQSEIYLLPKIVYDLDEKHTKIETIGLMPTGSIYVAGASVSLYLREDEKVPGYILVWQPDEDPEDTPPLLIKC